MVRLIQVLRVICSTRSECSPLLNLLVFKSLRIASTDTSMAAPNGCPKLIIPCENSLVSVADCRTSVSRKEGCISLEQRHSNPDPFQRAATAFVAIEFSPYGAFPFVGIPMEETANGLFDSEALFGKWGAGPETLCNLEKQTKR